MKIHALFTRLMAALLLLSVLSSCTPKTDKTADTAKPWSVRMAESDMARNPEAWMIDFRKSAHWGYTNGLVCKAILDVYGTYGDEKFYNYVRNFADTMVREDGSIFNYEVAKYNIDYINSGKILFPIYAKEKDPKYLKALQLQRSQLNSHPRTSQGGFWHKQIYEHQMWLDGLYMGTPFYAQYSQMTNDTAGFNDVANQFMLVKEHLYDSATGLYRHGWDESRNQRWSDSITGQSPHVWGRAVGWFVMAIVDVLDYLPQDHAKRPELIEQLSHLMQTLTKYQDSTGVWYQVLDMPDRQGNYRESTCSAMFTYTMLKGIRKKYLPENLLPVAQKAYNGILAEFVRLNSDSTYSITNCCAVAGLGGKNYRDGSFDYYINEPVRDDDPKAIGPFILASLEFESLGLEATVVK